ncbi:hypothetical protein EDB89DRAFT_1909515 [Lactarius sanguifluus]|nr:hypothetical protein EDB89DRAFT_1909515 [Lactarius sanguifluus]
MDLDGPICSCAKLIGTFLEIVLVSEETMVCARCWDPSTRRTGRGQKRYEKVLELLVPRILTRRTVKPAKAANLTRCFSNYRILYRFGSWSRLKLFVKTAYLGTATILRKSAAALPGEKLYRIINLSRTPPTPARSAQPQIGRPEVFRVVGSEGTFDRRETKELPTRRQEQQGVAAPILPRLSELASSSHMLSACPIPSGTPWVGHLRVIKFARKTMAYHTLHRVEGPSCDLRHPRPRKHNPNCKMTGIVGHAVVYHGPLVVHVEGGGLASLAATAVPGSMGARGPYLDSS